MKNLPFKQVDAFTARPFMGNPVAVILGGEDLDTATMQRITRWTNLSEATFVLPSKVADYRLRIFSPTMELPFAGHPTLGSAHAAIESGIAQPKDGVLRQECGAGIVELKIADGILMRAPEVKVSDVRGKLPFAKKLLRLSVGPTWITGEAESAAALAALKPDMAALAQFSVDYEATGITVFAASGDSSSAIHVRSFAPAHNIPEDPVCGSGNICVAAYLRSTNQLARFGGGRYVARQGMQMGRDGHVSVRIEPDAIWIGGHSVTCIDGTIRI